MARIAIGGMQHETNTFAPTKADLTAFDHGGGWPALYRGPSGPRRVAGANIPVAGAIEALPPPDTSRCRSSGPRHRLRRT